MSLFSISIQNSTRCSRSFPCYFGKRWPDLQFDFENVNLREKKNIFKHPNSRNGAVWKKYVKLSNLCANLNTRSAFFTCLSSFFQSSKEAWSIYLKKYVERQVVCRKVRTVKKFPLSKKFIWLRTDIHPWWHEKMCTVFRILACATKRYFEKISNYKDARFA